MSEIVTILQAERKRVEAKFQEVTNELARIDKVIAMFSVNGNGNGTNLEKARAALAVKVAAEGTLRDDVIRALRSVQPARAHEVTKVMRANHPELRGQRGLEVRVGHTLSALCNADRVKRLRRGIYEVAGR